MAFQSIGNGPLALDERQVFRRFRDRFDIRGRRILEIGGCLPTHLTAESAIWWSVDPRHPTNRRHGHLAVLRAKAEQMPAEVDEVDLVFACNSFQHVGDMAGCYAALARRLRPGGAVYANFGPIWSAPDGAHFEGVSLGERRYDFWDAALMPSWSHLVLSEGDFRRLAIDINGAETGVALADYVERSTWVNRLTLADHLALPKAAGLTVESTRGTRAFGYRYRPPRGRGALAEMLSATAIERFARDRLHLSLANLRIRDLELVLRRP